MCHVDKGDTHAGHLRSWIMSSLLCCPTSMVSMYKTVESKHLQYYEESSRETRSGESASFGKYHHVRKGFSVV
jgi:hypothetical protein